MQALSKPEAGRADSIPIRAVARRRSAIPLALALIAITTFFPEELSFYIVGLRFTATRLIFIMLTPVLIVRLGQKISTGRYRFVLSDLLIVLAGIWMIYAPANIEGLTESLNHSGPIALEFCIGYLAARVLLSEHGQAVSFANLLCRVIAIVGVLALLDPLTGRYLMHELAGDLTGYTKHVNWEDAYRMGMLRAFGPVEHPILLAFICVTGLLIAMSVPVRSRLVVMLACSLGAAFAFSSAPLQGLIMGLALLLYDRMVGAPFRWFALVAIGAVAIATAFLVSNSPVGFIISHMTFDPSSGYYRVWTWASVIDAVSMSPWYGLGFGPYPDALEINHSIDSLWLVAAIQFGVPGSILIALTMIGAVSLRVTGAQVNLTAAESRLGTTLGIVIFLIIFLSFTVDLWGTTWILAALLTGMRAHLGELGKLDLDRPVPSRSNMMLTQR
jgi:hypothetical protein